MNLIAKIVDLNQGREHQALNRVIPNRFSGNFGFLLDFDRETGDGEEFGERQRLIGERAVIEGEKEELEIGKPGDEEGGNAAEMHGMEVQREEDEEKDDRKEDGETIYTFGD